LLGRQGYNVLDASGATEALRISAKTSIDLLLTDVVMPDMSGRELADKMKSKRPAMKVVYMSGYTDNAIVHHGVLDPDVHFISKPFNLEALTTKVRQVLDQK
jgi:DNA-binding NtrC family response regulator